MHHVTHGIIRRHAAVGLMTLTLWIAAGGLFAAERSRNLADWKTWPVAGVETNRVQAQPGDDGWLVVRAQKGQTGSKSLLRPEQIGIGLKPTEGLWNLEAFNEIAVSVRNLGDKPIRIALRVDDDQAVAQQFGRKGAVAFVDLPTDKTPRLLSVPLGGGQPSPLADKFFGMRWNPPEFARRGTVDCQKIAAVRVLLQGAPAEWTIAVGPVVAQGETPCAKDLTFEKVFPLIDEYGQYIHRDWPEKIKSDQDLAERLAREEKDLAAHGRPSDWNQYGGWAAGPKLKATGSFRVEKINGWWWMVDPEGCLFWSHGVVRVGTRVRVGTVYHGTPITDREFYFRLPSKDSPLAAFFDTEPQATGGYYAGKEGHAVYDHLEANLFRKYGPDWSNVYAQKAQQRLASWALNTVANSSDPAVFRMRKTPYTAVVYSLPLGRSAHRIQGSQGGWGGAPDPFDPGLREVMRKTLQTELNEVLNDPWCLGFFVDNELHWGDTCYLAASTLASPADQPAKKAFLEELKKKYATIESLNKAWGTQHATWDALLTSTATPDQKKDAVRADLETFSRAILEGYFRACRDSIKEASPNHLYLGCRFAGYANTMVMEAAAKYSDVISINRYSATVDDLHLPAGLDRPIVIGEFSMGAVDRGMFHPGWQARADQAGRAKGYCEYVESALRNPAIIGTHWFQFYDQPTTGRFCGENMNFGLIDIGDTPHWEVINACRKMGAAMYTIRTEASRGAK